MKGRLLEGTLGDAYSNVALEEALLKSGGRPTLRVWRNQESVVIGRAQLAKLETDVDYCVRNYIPVVRRVSAGGAVYNGRGNLNWSYFVPTTGGALGGAKGVFESFAAVVVGALRECGVDARFEGPNSIVDARGKISGMAAYVSKDRTLCHGTLLVDADLGLAERLTRPSGEAPDKKYPRSRSAVMSNCGVNAAEFVPRLAGAGGYDFERGDLVEDEKSSLASLEGKYRSERWNLGDPFGLDDF